MLFFPGRLCYGAGSRACRKSADHRDGSYTAEFCDIQHVRVLYEYSKATALPSTTGQGQWWTRIDADFGSKYFLVFGSYRLEPRAEWLERAYVWRDLGLAIMKRDRLCTPFATIRAGNRFLKRCSLRTDHGAPRRTVLLHGALQSLRQCLILYYRSDAQLHQIAPHVGKFNELFRVIGFQ